MNLTRRQILKHLAVTGGATTLSASGLLLSDLGKAAAFDESRPYLAAATKAAEWISHSKISTRLGVTWPVAPITPQNVTS